MEIGTRDGSPSRAIDPYPVAHGICVGTTRQLLDVVVVKVYVFVAGYDEPDMEALLGTFRIIG